MAALAIRIRPPLASWVSSLRSAEGAGWPGRIVMVLGCQQIPAKTTMQKAAGAASYFAVIARSARCLPASCCGARRSKAKAGVSKHEVAGMAQGHGRPILRDAILRIAPQG